ncbi:MAG: phage major capsid protein [Acidimicrobiia bacterium]|nr:phage major capsid protein [Acidimicrobiia bacterium]
MFPLVPTGVKLEELLARQSGRSRGNAFGYDLVLGTGTGEPNGIITAASAGVTGGTGQAGVPTYNELVDVMNSVIPSYQVKAEWLMSPTTWAAILKIKDDQNNPLIGSLADGAGVRLLGKRVVLDPNIADVATSAESIAFGDFSGYHMRFAGGVRFDRSDDFAFANDLVTFGPRCGQTVT